MEASEVQNVCRLCPETGANQPLLNVFDPKFAEENNMKDVILVTTGIEVSETDLVSRKICQRCCNITLKMLQFRQDALKQDKELKAKCKVLLERNGFNVPNSDIEVKDEPENEPTEGVSSAKKNEVHPSIQQLYTKYPNLKLSKSLVQLNLTPMVSLPKGEVETYFDRGNLNMNSFIYKSPENTTSAANKELSEVNRIVLPIKISRKEKEKYTCTTMLKRKLSTSGSESDPAKVFKKVALEKEKENKNSLIDGSSDPNQTAKLTTVKSKTLHECHICRSFHSTLFALNYHLSKHKACQFCKKKFKSLEAKDKHLESSCEIQKVLTSQAFVSLEPIHLNHNIRSKYSQLFEEFPSLPSKDTCVEVNVVEVVGEDELRGGCVATLPSSTISNSVSIVKPDVAIKNNPHPCDVIGLNEDQIFEKILRSEKELAKSRKKFTERMVQTYLPSNLNIKINPSTGLCEFKGLKDQLHMFKIPIIISKGPFHALYEISKPNKKKVANFNLSSVPVASSRKIRVIRGRENNAVKVYTPAKPITTTRPPTVLNSQISKPIQSNAHLPRLAPLTNSTSATPLLQSYVSSMPKSTPVLGFQDFQRTFLNAAHQNRSGKQVVTTVSKVLPNRSLGSVTSTPQTIINTSNNIPNIQLVTRGNQYNIMPTPHQNRTITTLNSVVVPNSGVVPNRVVASTSSNTTNNSEMRTVRSITPHGVTLNTRLVPILYNTGRDQVKTPNQGAKNNMSVLKQNGIGITREASKPNQYPKSKKTVIHVVGKKSNTEVAESAGITVLNHTVVQSVPPTKDSNVNEKVDATSVGQPSGVSNLKPVFRVKNIRELQ